MDQLGVRRVRRLPCGRYQPSFRKAGSPHRWTNLEYGASAVFHAAGANPHSERPGPRSDGRSVFLFRFFAISEIENANRRLGLARVRGPASSDPRGAYAASKTADTPYSKLATQSARLGLHSGRPKRQPQIGPRSCAGSRQFRSARGLRRIEDGGHAVLQVGGRTPSWRRCSGGLAGVWVDRSPGPGRGAQEVTARANASAVRLWAWAKPPTSRAARTETSTSPKSPNENNSADLGNRSRYASRASA